MRPDRLGEVLADLVRRDVEGGGELDVPDVVAAEVDVHEPGDELVDGGVLVELHALEEGVGAVADSDDRDANLVAAALGAPVLGAVPGSHRFLSLVGRSEPLVQRLDDQLVGGPPPVGGTLAQALLERTRHPEKHVAPGGARRSLPPGRLVRDPEARGEDLDREVVQVGAARD